MNNYLVASTRRYYQNQYYGSIRDRRYDFMLHQGPSLNQNGLGGLLAYGLNLIGLPSNVAHLGYRFGSFLDNNA
ncbi:MAG: hypothetical protein JNN26_27565 [Candidatus Obscuribacter sp.]|nr:hypothetical protein [Candidatus Obscuribacter sp.]